MILNIDEGQPHYRLHHSTLVRNITTGNSTTLSKPTGYNNLLHHQKGVRKGKRPRSLNNAMPHKKGVWAEAKDK
jgi:hypothetical protein